MPLTLIALSKADDKDADLVWSVVASIARNSANAGRTRCEHPPPDGPMHLSDSAMPPLRTLDRPAALDDLERLDETAGDARVVAIGESAQYNRGSSGSATGSSATWPSDIISLR